MKKNKPTNYAQALYAISQITKTDQSEMVNSLVTLLRRKNALGQLPKILIEFKKYAAKKDGNVSLMITSAHPLSIETKEKINGIFGGQTEITETIDSALIGGLVIRTEDTIFDASIKKQLERLKNNLVS